VAEELTPAAPVVILGDVVTDIIVTLQEPLAFASDTRTSIHFRAGGSGANQAVWLATQTGLTVNFIGRVGSDYYGQYHAQELARSGVIPHLSIDSQQATGTIVVLVEPSNGERTMLTDRGANLTIKSENLPLTLFQAPSLFHLSGYTLFEPATRPVALTALEVARSRKMPISIDPSSASLLQAVGVTQFLGWTEGAALCFPNLEEGRLLSGVENPTAIVTNLAQYYGEVVLKLGPAGAVWGKRNHSPIHIPATTLPPSSVVDTTGAGDAFCAGFLSEWLRYPDLSERALKAGVQLGTLATTIIGARPI
jgi:sugar/nucleoside kinase (ribokinase family)